MWKFADRTGQSPTQHFGTSFRYATKTERVQHDVAYDLQGALIGATANSLEEGFASVMWPRSAKKCAPDII